MKAIIFDLFGTLTQGHADPEAEIINAFNLTFPYSVVEHLTCGTKFTDKEEYLRTIINGIGLAYSSEHVKKISDILTKEIEKASIHPDCEETLKKFKGEGYRIGLISNIPNPEYDLIGAHGLEHYFNSIVYSYKEGLVKPEREVFDRALGELHVEPGNALMVGDSYRSDVVGAKGAGMSGILISNKEMEFSDVRPYAVIPRLADVFDVAEGYFKEN